MKLNTIETMTEELAKSLIGKHIHFTYHNKSDHTLEPMPGKVLDYQNGKIKIDTMNILMLDDETPEEKNKNIRIFNIEDIKDIFPFDEDDYNHNYLTILDDVEEEDLNKTLYEIIVSDSEIITTTIFDFDFPLTITLNISGSTYDYPLYLIKSIKRIK